MTDENDLSALGIHPEYVQNTLPVWTSQTLADAAGDSDWLTANCRVIQRLDRGVEVVHVAVEDHPFHVVFSKALLEQIFTEQVYRIGS